MARVPSTDPQIMFGQTVKKLRLKRHLSQEALAELAGIHRNYLGETERGERNISLKNILRIAKALKIPPAKLFVGF